MQLIHLCIASKNKLIKTSAPFLQSHIYMAACNEFYWDIILPYKNFSYDSMSSLYAVCFPRFMPTAMVEKYTVRWFCLL